MSNTSNLNKATLGMSDGNERNGDPVSVKKAYAVPSEPPCRWTSTHPHSANLRAAATSMDFNFLYSPYVKVGKDIFDA